MEATHPAAVTDATFPQEVEQYKGLVVVDFWATWCGPCHRVAPIMEQLANEHAGKVKVLKVDVDANPGTAMRFNVRSIPSILFFKDGRHVDTIVGAYPKPAFDQKSQQVVEVDERQASTMYLPVHLREVEIREANRRIRQASCARAHRPPGRLAQVLLDLLVECRLRIGAHDGVHMAPVLEE